MQLTNTIQQTILLVEDNPADVLLIRRTFRNQEFAHVSLQVVGDGDAAVAYLSGEGQYSDRNVYPLPRVVLLDLKLPRRSGHEVLAWLKQQPGLKRLPVVILTSSRESNDLSLAYDLGANSYLVKPVGLPALTKMVNVFYDYWLSCNEMPTLHSD